MSEQPMNDNKFSRNFVGMLLLMTALTGALMFLASFNANEVNEKLQAEKDAEKLSNIVEQTIPISKDTTNAVASATPKDQVEEVDGETIYNGACTACHGAGIAGAPIVGDTEQWATRIAKGSDTLYASAINGVGAMPARGGQGDLSDEQVQAAVDYMIKASK